MDNRIVANWNFIYSNYGVKISSDKSSCNFFLTFDTGAAATILGSNKLFDLGITETTSEANIMRLLTISGVKPRIFYSATHTQMLGYPCVIEDIKLSGVTINKFYFYLFLGGDNPNVSLLGNDFLRYCSYTKKADSDIVINDIDFEKYEQDFIANCYSEVIFPVNKIYNELERIESTKDVASAFRYLMKYGHNC